MTDKVFVKRKFESGDRAVIARFYSPTLEAGGEYKCRWEIAWIDHTTKHYACGIDGIQALMLAMRVVHMELLNSGLYKSGSLTYLDQCDLDLPPGWGDGPLYGAPAATGN